MIDVNGAPAELAAGMTVSGIAAQMELPERGVAVAINGEVVPRARWSSTELSDGDRIEILTATQGG